MRVLFGLLALAALLRWTLMEPEGELPIPRGLTAAEVLVVDVAEPPADAPGKASAMAVGCRISERYRLLATLVTAGGLWPSMAVLTDDDRPSQVVTEGGQFDGMLVDAIDRHQVVLGEGECVLRRPSVAAAPPPAPVAPRDAPLIERLADGTLRVSRSAVERALTHNDFRHSVRAIFQGEGAHRVLRLLRIQAGSPLARLGLRSGDELVSVQGEQIASPSDALRLYGALREAPSVNFEIRRRGQAKTIEVALGP